ncbi:MAG: hypothetical protein KGI26_07405, partial [Thaumarchaeota archaeon]|nr:hypothetical protein [Nitrososphaerota archaeon]
GTVYFLTYSASPSTPPAIYGYTTSGTLTPVVTSSGHGILYSNMDQAGNLYFMAVGRTSTTTSVTIGEVKSQSLASGTDTVTTLTQTTLDGRYVFWVGDSDNFVVSSSGEVFFFLLPVDSSGVISGAALYGLAPNTTTPVLLLQTTTDYGFDVFSMATVGSNLYYVSFATAAEGVFHS